MKLEAEVVVPSDLSTGAKTIGIQMLVGLESGPVGSGTIVRTFKPGNTTYYQLTISKNAASISCP